MADLCFQSSFSSQKATQTDGEADIGATQPGFRLPPYPVKEAVVTKILQASCSISKSKIISKERNP
jgi:hypothetical protein